jgi:hypothetical protein
MARRNSVSAAIEAIPESGPDPSYRDIVANHLKSTFKQYFFYDAFEISDPRWVHSFKGWNWLICVRFEDKRTYTFFLDGNNIVDARYAVQTDQCGTQAYGVFEQMGGSGLPPLYQICRCDARPLQTFE